MTKQKMEKRIAELEREVSELKNQLIFALSNRTNFVVVPSAPDPNYTVPWSPGGGNTTVPYPSFPLYPIITCQNQNC